jgi:hypothetical protein
LGKDDHSRERMLEERKIAGEFKGLEVVERKGGETLQATSLRKDWDRDVAC